MKHVVHTFRKPRKDGGFTLVEMAIVILIIGLITGSVFALINPLNKNMREANTREKAEYVANAIANYAAKYNRIPCPAPPDPDDNNGAMNKIRGIMYTDGASGRPDCGSNSNRVGIVPFRTLGIHPDMAIDGWGNYFTYAVSPVFAEPTGNTAHGNCRDSKWMDETTHNNIAPDKAKFCCPGIHDYDEDNDIILKNDAGDPDTKRLIPERENSGGNYGNVDVEESFDADENTSAVAYVLISHGINHYGSYLINSADPSDRDDSIATSDNEEENADDDKVFITTPRVLDEGSDYFDDLVLWRTQEQVRYEFGNDSCSLP